MRSRVVLVLLLLIGAVAPAAFAAQSCCADDAQCNPGFFCLPEPVGSTTCSASTGMTCQSSSGCFSWMCGDNTCSFCDTASNSCTMTEIGNDCCGQYQQDPTAGARDLWAACCAGLVETTDIATGNHICCNTGQIGANGLCVTDTSPPYWGQPIGLIATNARANSLTVSWVTGNPFDAGTGISYYNIYRNGVWVGKTRGNDPIYPKQFTDFGLEPGKKYAYKVGAVDYLGLEGNSSSVNLTAGSAASVSLIGPNIKAISTTTRPKVGGLPNEFEILYHVETVVPSVCSFTISKFVNGALLIVASAQVTPIKDQSFVNQYLFKPGQGSYALQPTCWASCGTSGVGGTCGGDERAGLPSQTQSQYCPQDCGCNGVSTGFEWNVNSQTCVAACGVQYDPVTVSLGGSGAPGAPGYLERQCQTNTPNAGNYVDLTMAWSRACPNPAHKCIQCMNGYYSDPITGNCDRPVQGDGICAPGEPLVSPDCCPDATDRPQCTGSQQTTCSVWDSKYATYRTTTFTCGLNTLSGCWEPGYHQSCAI